MDVKQHINNIPSASLFRLVHAVSYAISLYRFGPAVPLVSHEEAVVWAHLADGGGSDKTVDISIRCAECSVCR